MFNLKKFALFSIFACSLPLSAHSLPTSDELCSVPSKNVFANILSNMSSFLAASEPELRHSQTNKGFVVNEKIVELPRLENAQSSKAPKRPLPKVYIEREAMQIAPPPALMPELSQQPSQASAKLAPKTQRVFDDVQSGIGEEYVIPRNITINRSAYKIPEYKSDVIDDEFEEIETPEIEEADSAPKFEISVSNSKPRKQGLELREEALKALSVGQYESAIALYKKLLKTNPKDRDIMFGLATAYHKAGERKQARNAYAKLIKAYPRFEDGINNFISLASAEAPEQALRELQDLQKTNPKFPAIFAQKGVVYSKLGDKKQALKNLAYALKLSPDNNDYKYNLAVVLDELGKAELASQLYQELVRASYNGQQIPVGRKELEERSAHIIAQLNK